MSFSGRFGLFLLPSTLNSRYPISPLSGVGAEPNGTRSLSAVFSGHGSGLNQASRLFRFFLTQETVRTDFSLSIKAAALPAPRSVHRFML